MPMALVHQKHTLETLLYCVSIFQLISSLPTYPQTTVNLNYTYHFLFHSRFVVYCRTYVYVTVSFVNQPIVLFSCVSIFQLISSLPTYPPTPVNLTYTYPYLFHSRCSVMTCHLLFAVPP